MRDSYDWLLPVRSVVAVLLLAACADPSAPRDTFGPTPLAAVDVAGSYALQTVVGHPLPYTTATGVPGLSETKVEQLVADTLTLAANGTWQRRTHSRRIMVTNDTVAMVNTSAGSFVHSNASGQIEVSFSGVTLNLSGTVIGPQLTLYAPTVGNPWVYQR